MAPGEGYGANPIYNILPEVPMENSVAIYRTTQVYRYRFFSDTR